MIKLNNKNITYVALADSNNSLKAPKEIWYADSSNSVKLVYRRKDALIEGEDYEKYHWLKTGSGNPYIQVANDYNMDNNAYLETTFKCASVNPDKDIVIGFGSDDSFGYRLFDVNSRVNIDIHKRTSGVLTSKRLSFSHSPYQICNVFINSNRYEFNSVAGTYELDNGFDTELKQNYTRILTNQSNNDMYYAETKMRVNNVEYDLIPCKLLKPVPKWLDANGIMRQVGECGMIDLVSGKFYGNVNSVGTFTVENYYERKEWLKGDIPIGTRMMTLPVNSDTFYFRRIWKSFGNSSYFITNGYGYYTYFYQKKVSIYDAARSAVLGNFGSEINVDEVIEIDSNSERMIMHNVEVPKYGFPIISIRLDNGSNGVDSVTHYTSVIFVDGIERYIPCTLTMDLPASMDANNIARAKGTSGMWDLVSDRFYGNVANSGTFKAVNLAEGLDYEVYDWLQGDGTAYIEGIQYNLWDNHIVLRVGKIQNPRSIMSYSGGTDKGRLHIMVNTDTVQSEPYLMVTFRELDSPAVHIADIRPFSSMPDIVDMDFYISNSTFYCEQNEVVKTNNPSQTAIESSWSSITPKIQSSKMSYIREVLPNDTYRSNLIPVKLLRSIPSKYDANGIARQAGECGMYDTVNDVFYGNVASSGSFTVSDDY